MKKTAIASVALAAALFAVSCQKENTLVENVSGPMTISAVSEGLNTPTKTELAFKYDVLWSSTDKIYVVDGQGNNDTFSLTGGAGTTKGTFKQDHEVELTGEVEAYYPATMLDGGSPVWPASQTNDQTIPMYCKKTLSGTTDERMDFSSLGSVLQIVFNTTQENVTLKSIEIKDGSATLSGAFTVDTDGKAVISATDKAGITLDLGTGVALGKAANYFNIAVPAGDYQDLTLVFTATDGKKCTMTGGKVNIAYNAVGRLTLMGEKFKADLPDGALAGKFSVSATKKVYFSKGNLTYNVSTTTWAFYEHQYGCATGYDSNLISLFTWGYDAVKSIVPDGSAIDNVNITSGNLSQEQDWGSQIGDGNTWRTLSTAEWQYLFNYGDYTSDVRNGKYKWATVNGVNGYVIAPDDFSGELANTYADDAALAANNLVFLPAAGGRGGSYVSGVGDYGSYWSSTALDEDYAYFVDFGSYYVLPGLDRRYLGLSVRLITEPGAPAPQVISVESVSLNKSTLELAVGSDETLTATVTPDNATDKNVSWSSSDESVATVDASGKVTAVAAGTATITVTTTDGGKTTTCAVTVIPAGALAGEFTVDASGKKVHFSQGNLYWDGSKFKFEANQYGFNSSYQSTYVSHFYWSKDASVAYAEGYNDGSASGSDVFFTNKEDFKVNVDGIDKTGWRTLSTDEWTYLFNNHLYKWASVNGKTGYVIAPDGFAGTLSDTYADDAALATAGNLVFLPAAGFRGGSRFYNVGDLGYYWSSTANVKYFAFAYCVCFDSSDVGPGNRGNRFTGYSVRLITEPGAPAPQVISVESVSLNKSTLELAVGSDETLTATVTPDNATDKNVSWSSSDESVATVDASGKVTAVAAGTATITVTTTDGGKTTTCAVTVIPAGALAGEFSVSATKTVYFSQGNLYWDGSAFKFEANQYSGTSYANNHVSHFYWSKDASVAYAEGYNDGSASESDVFFTNEDETTSKNGFTVNVGGTEQTGWRTLSNNEWQYLFNSRTDAASKVGYATVGGVHGIIILPDTFTDPMKNNNGNGAFVPKSSTDWTQNVYTSGNNWNAMETAGAVFLPVAGFRDGSDVYYVGVDGHYWSSTAGDSDLARLMWFSSSVVSSGNYASRSYGNSVRLITEPGAPAPQVISVESVSLNKSTLELAVGSDETLTATVTPDNATDKNVSWSSSDESVATVDASGKVTAVAAGTATITVTTTDGGKTTTCAVTVIPAGALAGEFTVDASGKKVHFSKGNLTYNVSTTTWAFYEHQYDYATGYDSNLISLFTWGYGTWSTSPDSKDYQTGDFTDWGSQIGDGNTWRTLSTAEWQYLFNNHSKKWATVNGVGGYVIAPDNVTLQAEKTSYTATELNDANLVFLPAAGSRVGSDVGSVGGCGIYWSSTAYAYGENLAHFVYFDSNDVLPGSGGRSDGGSSVRLITDVK